eukprot:6838132-Ditylum_brightwellii.AAC.1
MKRRHMARLGKKNRYIMYMLTQVAHRKNGMSYSIFNFHAVVHLVEGILLYCVPKEVNTGTNKSHHKPTKQAAKLTQRKESTFNDQTAILDAMAPNDEMMPWSRISWICIQIEQPVTKEMDANNNAGNTETKPNDANPVASNSLEI